MSDNNGKDTKTKSGLANALTTSVQGGAKKSGGLLSAIGGKSLSGPAASTNVQHVDRKTLNALDTVRKGGVGKAGHMAYIIDATASRSDTWNEAQRIQSEMFREAAKSGDLKVQLVHFGGGSVNDRGWFNSASSLSDAMARVSCQSGHTQITDSVDAILKQSTLPSNIVLIGDCFEEGEHDLKRVTAELVARRIKVFAFLDVLDGEGNGAEAYRYMAEKTGGSFQYFGRGMDLKGLIAAVAAYTAGGDAALQKLASTSKEAKAIGQNVLRLSGPSGPAPKP